MPTLHFMQGQSEPIDPTVTVENENEKSVHNNSDGGSGDSGQEEEEHDDVPMQKGPGDPVDRTAHHQQQPQQQQEDEQNGGVSGVRKILHPGEALDSARHTAELIMKDAMDALMRTKQRLMEILPSLTPSHSPGTSKVVENVKKNVVENGEGKGILSDETESGEEKGYEGLASKKSRGITSNPTMGNNLNQSSSDIRQSITIAARL